MLGIVTYYVLSFCRRDIEGREKPMGSLKYFEVVESWNFLMA